MCNPHTTALCNDSEKLFGRLSQSYVTSKNERRVNITFEFTVRISGCARLRRRTIDAIAGSCGRRNTGLKNIRWGFPVQCLPGSGIELSGDQIQLSLADNRQVSAFGIVLAEQAVGVLVAAALPGTGRIAEVDFYIGGNAEPPVGGKFGSSIPGQRRH